MPPRVSPVWNVRRFETSPALCKVGAQQPNTTQLQVTLEDKADGLGLGKIDDQLAVGDVIAEGRIAAHPDAFLLGGGELVADALAGDLALELGEGQQDVEGQPSHGGGRVERLRHRDKGHALAVEHLHEPGKVHQRTAEPVDLVDHHHVDLPGFDVRKKPPQRRSFQCAAGVAAVVVSAWESDPAFGLLADDISRTGLALGVEAVEVLFKSFFGRFARVEGAADGTFGGHDASPGLTDFLYQRDGDYCIAAVPSRWDIGGANVCGAGGRYPSDECGLTVL